MLSAALAAVGGEGETDRQRDEERDGDRDRETDREWVLGRA